MLTLLANIIGSGAGAIIIGVSVFFMAHVGRFPSGVQPWLRRGLIVAMYCGGATLAFTEVGILWTGVVNHISSWLGVSTAYGVPRVVIVLASVALLAGTVVGLVWAPTDAVAMTAVFVPFLLMLVPGGFLHNVFVVTAYPGQQLAASFNVWIAG
jgi:hypothetical protein